MRPSFLGLAAGGLLIGMAAILIAINYRKISILPGIFLLLVASIAVSAHSVLHFYEEIHYGWNPLVGNWRITG